MKLVYIDDVVNELINALGGKENRIGDFCEVPIVHTINLGEIVRLIYSFKRNREEELYPDMSDEFTKKLYNLLSYLPVDKFIMSLK